MQTPNFRRRMIDAYQDRDLDQLRRIHCAWASPLCPTGPDGYYVLDASVLAGRLVERLERDYQ